MRISQSDRGRVNNSHFAALLGVGVRGPFLGAILSSRVLECWGTTSGLFIISQRQELVGGVREQHNIQRDRVVWWDNNLVTERATVAKASGEFMSF